MTTYAINTVTGASTKYTDYGFNSMFKGHDGKYYGVKADGLYVLEGAAKARADFGDLNFGTSLLKRLINAYVSCSAEGPLEVQVTAEGSEYAYPLRDVSAEMQAQRADVGKGLRANFFGVALANQEGADFSIDAVELTALPLARRI